MDGGAQPQAMSNNARRSHHRLGTHNIMSRRGTEFASDFSESWRFPRTTVAALNKFDGEVMDKFFYRGAVSWLTTHDKLLWTGF